MVKGWDCIRGKHWLGAFWVLVALFFAFGFWRFGMDDDDDDGWFYVMRNE
jgi:hypothetical protein